MEILKEQAANFWNYCTLPPRLELDFYIEIPLFFKSIEQNRQNFYDDCLIKHNAELLAGIINELNLPEEGENNKCVGVLCMARAYVKYLKDHFDNGTYMNPGSFWLICCRVAMHIN